MRTQFVLGRASAWRTYIAMQWCGTLLPMIDVLGSSFSSRLLSWDSVNADFSPEVWQIIVMLQKDDAIVGCTVRAQKEATVTRSKYSWALRHQPFGVNRSNVATKNGIKCALAYDEVKWAIFEGERSSNIDADKPQFRRLRRLLVVASCEIDFFTFLHLINDYSRKVNIDNLTVPAILSHVFSKARVAAAQYENTTYVIARKKSCREGGSCQFGFWSILNPAGRSPGGASRR